MISHFQGQLYQVIENICNQSHHQKQYYQIEKQFCTYKQLQGFCSNRSKVGGSDFPNREDKVWKVRKDVYVHFIWQFKVLTLWYYQKLIILK
jgi:hypothetical protein